MSADNRSTHTDALATLGTVIDHTGTRDAIHLAVISMVAGENLNAGNHVKVIGDKAYYCSRNFGFGIVDPFLTVPVARGEKFWLVVYPRQITSLMHVWEHPNFPKALN